MYWDDFKVIVVIVVLFVLGGLAFAIPGWASRHTETITVKDKWIDPGSNQSAYLVLTTDDNILTISDAMIFLVFDSSDRWGQIEIGKTYEVEVYGWRIRFLSMYPDIIKVVHEIDGAE